MDVVSLCQLPVASLRWQARPGAFMLTIVAKATYELRPLESHLAAEQEFPNDDENHWDDDAARSLYSPSDLVPTKPRADVVLVGHAFAPNGETVRSLVARLLVGSIDKSIEVFSDRSFSPEGVLRYGPRFSSMPLRYERAAGGPGTDNPVGLRIPRGEGPLPNLQPVGMRVVRPGDHFAPTGFGPIAAGWPERRKKLGRHAALFASRRWADVPLPAEIDRGYFNAAPADQQLDRLEPDQRLVLENLSSWGAMMTTRLPGVRARAVVDRGGQLEEIALVADTLWIDNDRSLATLTFRGTLALRHALESGRVMVLLDEPGRALSWTEVERVCRAASPAPEISDERTSHTEQKPPVKLRSENTQEFRLGAQGAALPFVAPEDEPTDDPQNLSLTATDLPGDALDASPPWLARSGAFAALATPPPIAPPPVPPPSVAGAPPPPMTPPSLATNPPSLATNPPSLAGPIPAPPPSSLGMGPLGVRSSGEPGAMLGAFGSSSAEGAIPAPSRSGAYVAPPPVVPRSPDSLRNGVLDASNAAAASASWTLDEPEPARAPEPAPVAAARPAPSEIFDLLWFDPELPAKLRPSESFREIIAAAQPKPPDVAYDDDPTPEEPQGSKDLRDVSVSLARGPIRSAEDLERAIADASGEYGVIDAPIVLVAGDLETPFDEIETLRATLAAAAPIAPSDKKLKESFDTVSALAGESWIEGSRGVAEGLTARLREAFAQAGRAVPQGWLETHVERRLVEQRRYEKRTLLGKTWIRALVSPGGVAAPIPTYVPDALATKLPLYPRFRVRLLATLHVQQDQYESHPLALEVVALARVVSPGARARR